MGALLGPKGGLIEVGCSSTLDVEAEPRHEFEVTLGGRRLAYVAPVSRRSWSVTVGTATPDEASNLGQILSESFAQQVSRGPFWWLDEWAQVSNMLTPAQSMCEAGVWSSGNQSGPAAWGADFDGFRPLATMSHTAPAASTLLSPVPGVSVVAPAGRPFTVSVYGAPWTAAGANPGTLRVVEVAHDGAMVRTHTSKPTSGPAAGQRLVVQGVTLAATVGLRVEVRDLMTWAAPQVTLTPDIPAWAEGAGAHSVVADRTGIGVQMATPDATWGRRAGFSFAVHEVG